MVAGYGGGGGCDGGGQGGASGSPQWQTPDSAISLC